MNKKIRKLKEIPKTSIAVAIISLFIHLSNFFNKGVPYETMNFRVVFTVFFSSSLKIVLPLLVIYVLFTFFNSGSKKFIKPNHLHKIYELSIYLLASVLVFTLGTSLLIKAAVVYPYLIGGFSNAVIYIMIGLTAFIIEKNVLDKNQANRQILTPIILILGFFYFLGFSSKIFIILFFVAVLITLIIKLIKKNKNG